LGEEELKKMIADKEVTDVQCEMCGKKYRVDSTQVKLVYQDIKKFH
jgi:redox-regulated HSP33 family molecular chaperone